MLATGTADNTTSTAFDFLVDFTGLNAGTLSLDVAAVANSTGNRVGTLRVYGSTNGTTFTDLTSFSATNNVVGSATLSVTLPASFNNSSTARFRLYYHNGTGGSTGSRPKISVDNLTVTGTAAPSGPSLTASPTTLSGFNANQGTASAAQTYTITSNSLAAGISVSATTGIELSSDNSTFTPTLSLPQATTAVVFARLNSAVSAGPFSGTISNSSGSLLANVAINGTVTDPNAPALFVSPAALSGFSTPQGTPSSEQTYTITAANLTASVSVSAPAGVQISQTTGTGFAASLTLPISTTSAVIYARLTGIGSPTTVSGTITNVSGSLTANVAISGTVSSTTPVSFTLISQIQGSGSTAALTGTQTVDAIVTRKFTGLSGFYIEEEDADQDGNPATSEGIFVYDPSGYFTGNVGDKVRITGAVTEYTSTANGNNSSLTQITLASAAGVSVVSAGNPLPTVVNVQLPVANVSDLERYEGMLINLSAASGNLTVTEYFQLARYGQVVLSATDADTDQPGSDARLDQYTQFFAPSVSGYATYLANIAKRRIYLDDGNTAQNTDPIIFGRGGNPLSASNTLRGGDQLASITAVLDERLEGYRLQTRTGSDANFIASNPRPATPPAVGGTLRAASFNVLNYFNTFGSTNFTNCGGTSIAGRGADNATEFTRQSDKIVNAIINSGADVMGLNEMQNNGFGNSSAIQDLVTKLNSVAGAGSFTFVNSGCISTDAITVAIIYKPAKVTPVGASAGIPLNYGTGAFSAVGRGSLAQTFQQNSNNEVFTVIANHWKSKGSSAGGSGDTDANDGQGLSNGTRTRQAQDLVSWLSTKPTGTNDPDYLIVGDLNAYAKEDPLTTLEAGGYTNVVPNTTYSYVFDGQVGALDHGLRSASLQAQVTGADKWHINADEPTALDYNTNFKSAGQITSLYSSEPYRASDHDPVIIGLSLGSACAGGVMTVKAGAWNDPTVWSCNTVPTAADNVTIKHTVNVPTNYVANVKNVLLDTNGKLSYESNGRLLLNP